MYRSFGLLKKGLFVFYSKRDIGSYLVLLDYEERDLKIEKIEMPCDIALSGTFEKVEILSTALILLDRLYSLGWKEQGN